DERDDGSVVRFVGRDIEDDGARYGGDGVANRLDDLRPAPFAEVRDAFDERHAEPLPNDRAGRSAPRCAAASPGASGRRTGAASAPAPPWTGDPGRAAGSAVCVSSSWLEDERT